MKKTVKKRTRNLSKSFKAKTIRKSNPRAVRSPKTHQTTGPSDRIAPLIPPILLEVEPPVPPLPPTEPNPLGTPLPDEEPLLVSVPVVIPELLLQPVPEAPVAGQSMPRESHVIHVAQVEPTPMVQEIVAPVSHPIPEPGVMASEASPTTTTSSLPESYGTGALHLLTLDPHCLYATWDFDERTLQQHRDHSADGQLHLRLYAGFAMRECVDDIRLNAEADNWFIPVRLASMEYQAELGYHNTKGVWKRLAQSGPVFAPPDAPASPSPVTFIQLSGPTAVPSEPSQAPAEAGPISVSGHVLSEPPPWTSVQEAALEEMVAGYFRHLAVPSSAELQEQAQRKAAGPTEAGRPLPGDVSSLAAMPTSPGLPSSMALPSSPGGVPSGPAALPGRRFWFNINAELVIYGATEPDARVTMGGHPIPLRPDGSFCYRFILPDGVYNLPVKAVAGDGLDMREALLGFVRHTDYTGHVEVHPQDPALKPPGVEHIA